MMQVRIGNPSLTVDSLTADPVRGIFSGEITNWKEVGGPDQAIEVYYRDDHHSCGSV